MVAGRLTARRPRTHGLRTKTRGQSGHTRAGVGGRSRVRPLRSRAACWVRLLGSVTGPGSKRRSPKGPCPRVSVYLERVFADVETLGRARYGLDESSHGGSAQAQRGDAPFASGARAEGRGLEVRCPEGPGSRRQLGEGQGAESPDRSTPPAPPPPPQASGPSTVRGTRLSVRPVRELRSWAARKPPRPRGEPPRVMSRADRGARGSGRRRDHSCKPSLDPESRWGSAVWGSSPRGGPCARSAAPQAQRSFPPAPSAGPLRLRGVGGGGHRPAGSDGAEALRASG